MQNSVENMHTEVGFFHRHREKLGGEGGGAGELVGWFWFVILHNFNKSQVHCVPPAPFAPVCAHEAACTSGSVMG